MAIKQVTMRWRDILCFWIGKLDIGKMTIVSKVIYRVNAVSFKLTIFFFFTELEEIFYNSHESTKDPK